MNRNDMESVYSQFKNTVYRAAFSCCKNHSQAEDVTSDTFYRYFTCKNPPKSPEHIKAWLIRTAINCCKDIFKSFRYKNVVPLDEARLVYETPEESDVYHAVMELEPKYRIVIHLYYYEGYTTKEISAMLRSPNATVRTRLARAREKLKSTLGKELMI